MVRNIFLWIFLWILCVSGSCNKDNCHKTISVGNNSDKTIFIQGHNGYPDTLRFKNTFPNPIDESRYKIESYSVNLSALATRKSCYEDKFNGSSLSSGILMVYVFDEEVLSSVPWDTIGKYYMILQRYDLTLDDLKGLNWEISYPPTEAMQNVQMYPPYKE